MQRIRPRFEYYAHRAPAISPVFGGVVVLQQPELFDGFGIGIEDNLVARRPIVQASIEEVGNRVSPPSRNADSVEAVGSPVVRAIRSNVIGNRNDARLR